MSTSDANVEIAQLRSEVERIEHNTAAVKEAIGRARNVRLCMLVALVLIVCVTCYKFWDLSNQVRGDEYKRMLVEIAQSKFLNTTEPVSSDQLYELLMKQVQTLRDSAQPVVTDTFRKQIEADMPKLRGLVLEQREILAENLKVRLQEELQTHVQEVVERHQSILREEFPTVTDEQLHTRMRTNFDSILKEIVDDYYVEELGNQVQTIFATYENFPVAGPLGDDEDRGQILLGHLMDLLTIRLTGTADDGDKKDAAAVGL